MTRPLAGLPVLSAEELRRYARHLSLPQVGTDGQRRLRRARVLIVGAGGLGSPAALYLAAAGVGTLGLVDHDRVDASNLQRQLLHRTSDVGRHKLDSAAERIADVNPGVSLERHPVRLTSANALDVMRGYDVVLDGSDNFPTRYLVNDACARLGVPDVFGSIYRFEGQASVFWAARGPCYRCLYREPPPPELVPSCEEAGVLGVLPGIIGTIQAIEAIKLLLDAGEPLVGRFLLFDALKMSFRELALDRDPDCPLCGERPTLDSLVDYEAFCGLTPAPRREDPSRMDVSVSELRQALDGAAPPVLLDVREDWEYQLCNIAGSRLVPIGTLMEVAETLDAGVEYVTICHTGSRSKQAALYLRSIGIPRVRSLQGGVESWAVEVDPTMARY